jgi:2-polyprenyl-6-methoxyphenol hydroxylase-like FAD-dependent oxidoreductase
MSVSIGKHAVVVGAGMGGLAAAKALSAHFDQVTVLDRDALPSTPQPRQGTPQSRHPHALLLSGQNALEKLCPNFASDLEAAGAVKMRVGVDLAWERPGFDPFPIRDLGFDNFFMSRPLLEFVTRKCVDEQHNVALLSRRRVTEIVASPDRVAVTGVHFEDAEGRTSTLHSDLVVDASGRGALTQAVLESLGLAKPEETEIGIDIAYATTVFDVPQDAPSSWKRRRHPAAGPGRQPRGVPVSHGEQKMDCWPWLGPWRHPARRHRRIHGHPQRSAHDVRP